MMKDAAPFEWAPDRFAYARALWRLGTIEGQAGTQNPAEAASDIRELSRAYRLGIECRKRTSFLHFVGFKDDRYWNALAIFGPPDFYHRVWDARAKQEVQPGDVAVFATGTIDDPVRPFTWDDSQQDILAYGGKELF